MPTDKNRKSWAVIWWVAGALLLLLITRGLGAFRFLVVSGFAIGLVVYNVNRIATSSRDRNFMLAVFFLALVLRIGVVMTYHFYSVSKGAEGFYYQNVYQKGNDEPGYHKTARVIISAFQKKPLFFLEKDQPITAYSRNIHFGYNIVLAGVYYLCGVGVLYGKLFNCFIGALAALYIYLIGTRFFNVNVGRMTAILVAVDTYAMLFSIFLFKEILQALMVVLFTWHFLHYVREKKPFALLWCFLIAIFCLTTRIYLGASMLFSMFVYYLVFNLPKDKLKRYAIIFLMILLSAPLMYLGGLFAYKAIAGGGFRSRIQGSTHSQRGVENSEEENMRTAFSPKRLIINGIRMFASPMPWRDISDKREPVFYVGYPGRWMWLLFMPFFPLGFYFMLKKRFKLMFVPMMSSIIYLFICSLVMMSGDRHQIGVMPILFLTSVTGFCWTKNPVLVYSLYLPGLLLFYQYDLETIPDFLKLAVVLLMIYLVYTFFLIRREIGMERFIEILKKTNRTQIEEDAART